MKKTRSSSAGNETKKKAAPPSAYWNKGFTSLYGLLFLLAVSILSAVLFEKLIARAKMMENVRRANLYLQQEAVALSHLKCALRNNQLHSEALEKSGVRLEIIPGTPVLIMIESPLPETLEVEIHNKEIYEYSYQRPEEKTR